MNNKLITALCVLLLTPGLLFAARPSVSAQEQALNILVDALVVCPPNSATRFVDNGDGTVCDHQTGLMWEMKDASDGNADLTNPHDVDNNYTWSSSTTAPDGTAFTDFLPRLNGEIADSSPSEQLGGHSDWRLPTSAELQNILDCTFGSPCIDPIFGPTTADNYWSSTSVVSIPTNAWIVDFSNGTVSNGDMLRGRFLVRAVRGGR